MDITTQDLNDKLETVVQMLNEETAVRGNADATLNGKLDALAKITAEDGADLERLVVSAQASTAVANTMVNARIDATNAIIAGLIADVAAIKQANDIAALALEVGNMRGVLEQLLGALSEENDGGEHTLEQVKAAYLAIVSNDADELTVAHIETADTVADDGVTYRLVNSTHDRSWEIPKTLVAEILAAEEDDQ